MNYQEAVLKQLERQTKLLADLVGRLERIEQLVAPQGPNYTYPLAAYANFDWAGIGAEVIGRDRQGVSRVNWFGKMFTRRSGAGKFGQAIWFSRCTGEDESGRKVYARLITFKDYGQAEPVPEQVAEAVNGRVGNGRTGNGK